MKKPTTPDGSDRILPLPSVKDVIDQTIKTTRLEAGLECVDVAIKAFNRRMEFIYDSAVASHADGNITAYQFYCKELERIEAEFKEQVSDRLDEMKSLF
jgi:hypothetical protein